jgi:hypothetical protein
LVLVVQALLELVTPVQVQYLDPRPPQVVVVVDLIQLRQQQAQMGLAAVLVIREVVEQQLALLELQTMVAMEVLVIVQQQLQVVVVVQVEPVTLEEQPMVVLAELVALHP